MAFFEPPPPPPPSSKQPYRQEWDQPDDVLGREVPIQFVLARSAMAIVAVRQVTAYPSGFSFQISLRSLPGHQIDMYGFHGWRQRRSDPAGLPDELFRFGIEFADGSTVTNLDITGIGAPFDRSPKGPVLEGGGGGGGERRYDLSYWVWPLPPAGPLAFVCEWPACAVPVTRHEIDSASIRAAAAESTPLWPSAADDGVL